MALRRSNICRRMGYISDTSYRFLIELRINYMNDEYYKNNIFEYLEENINIYSINSEFINDDILILSIYLEEEIDLLKLKFKYPEIRILYDREKHKKVFK